jgi:hypothetical protein
VEAIRNISLAFLVLVTTVFVAEAVAVDLGRHAELLPELLGPCGQLDHARARVFLRRHQDLHHHSSSSR